MIGDYVSVKPSGMLIKIAAVHHKKVAYHTVVHKLSWVRESLLEPIPLTPEILEKNGFIRHPLWHHCDKDLDNYSISVQLGYANRIEYIKIAEKGKDNVIPSERTKLYLTHIKYVHQLQQSMRLCGIEKEIEL